MIDKFLIDVSRTYRNKDGYDAGGYKLNSSFVTEEHTQESFVKTVIQEGWPYTMVHLKRSPKETGADSRNVKTPKHIENFVSMQVMTFDDDSQESGVVDGWLSDSLFKQYGWAFVESVNSKEGAEKGHPTLILDSPITDPDLYKECLAAFCWRHKRLDRLINIDRTIYNAEGARVHLLGNIMPFTVFVSRVLNPYRAYLMELERQAIETSIRQKVEYENLTAEEIDESEESVRRYVRACLKGIVDTVANATESRNNLINWAGYRVSGLQQAGWVVNCGDLFGRVEDDVSQACSVNGYNAEYGHGRDIEARRVYNLGFSANKGDCPPPPLLRKRNVAQQKSNEKRDGDEQPEPTIHKPSYERGYEDGWLDATRANAQLFSPMWTALRVGESLQGYFQLGYDSEKGALTTPYYDWNDELVNVEYNNTDYDTKPIHLFATDRTHRSAKYTIIVPNSTRAILSWATASEHALNKGVDNVIVLGLPNARGYTEWETFLNEIDSEYVYYIRNTNDRRPANIESLGSRVRELIINTTVERMLDIHGFDWLGFMSNKARPLAV